MVQTAVRVEGIGHHAQLLELIGGMFSPRVSHNAVGVPVPVWVRVRRVFRAGQYSTPKRSINRQIEERREAKKKEKRKKKGKKKAPQK